MKKGKTNIFVIVGLIFVILLTGCTQLKNNNNPLGLELKVSDVSSTGLKLTCLQSNTSLNEEVKTDLKYWVEKYENDVWIELEYNSPVHWDETASFTIPKNGEYYWTLYWSFYGELPNDKYRIKKIFNYKNDDYIYYAEFQIG